MFATTPKAPVRPVLAAALAALLLGGCTQFLQPDPLNKTASIVNGTQVTRGPVRSSVSSGFADTAVPIGSTFEPAVGDPFSADQLQGYGEGTADAALTELQNIDFGAEQTFIDQAQLGIANGSVGGDAASFAADIGQAVYFATDSSDLNERARETLRRQAAWLNVNESARITVEGHADERGTREYNLALGDRRASATRGYLIAVGIDEGRIDKISYGKERPVATGSDEEAWARNRRTETVVEDSPSFDGGFVDNPLPSGGDVSGIGNLVLDAPGDTPIDLFSPASPGSDPFVSQLTLDPDPLFTDPVPSAPFDPFLSTGGDGGVLSDAVTDRSAPGTITYDDGSFSTAPVTTTSPQTFGGSVAPTVFDSGPTYATSATPRPATSTGGATRIEDVSVDDLLRDPSLIDRIGTPNATATPGS